MPRHGGYRITFCNNNVPKVLGNVLTLLANCSLNVIDMVNKSRNEIAYNIIDVESQPSQELLEKISSVEGILSVRLL
jgi:D-3-phosphoglycerate dehydrogenase